MHQPHSVPNLVHESAQAEAPLIVEQGSPVTNTGNSYPRSGSGRETKENFVSQVCDTVQIVFFHELLLRGLKNRVHRLEASKRSVKFQIHNAVNTPDESEFSKRTGIVLCGHGNPIVLQTIPEDPPFHISGRVGGLGIARGYSNYSYSFDSRRPIMVGVIIQRQVS
jgi:hypothetical protein